MEAGLADASFPNPAAAPAPETARLADAGWRSYSWTPRRLDDLAARLAAAPFPALGRRRLLAAWAGAVAELRDPASDLRRALDPPLARLVGLSPEGLGAGLEAVLGGVSREPAARVFDEAADQEPRGGLVAVFLASNLPGLAAQPLLPALAVGRSVLLKSSSREPLFAPALVEALGRREPALRDVLAAVAWPGGRHELEAPVLARAERVLAYGGGEAMRDLEARAGGKLLPYGPKLSLAVVGVEVDPDRVAAGLARDVALFDQRGCLSIQAVYTAGDAAALARALAGALAERARAWPAGEVDPGAASAVQQLRAEALMRGLEVPPLELREGTVVVETRPRLRPSPGLRTVRVHPLPDLERLPGLLAPWRDRLQGAALAGAGTLALATELAELGVSRTAPPGELQSPDATWHNGGVSPLEALS